MKTYKTYFVHKSDRLLCAKCSSFALTDETGMVYCGNLNCEQKDIRVIGPTPAEWAIHRLEFVTHYIVNFVKHEGTRDNIFLRVCLSYVSRAILDLDPSKKECVTCVHYPCVCEIKHPRDE